MKKTILIACMSTLLFACNSTPPPKKLTITHIKNKDNVVVVKKQNEKQNEKPKEIKVKKNTKNKEKAKKEQIKALNARGFYINGVGDVNYYNERVCNDFELQSHRGHVNYPENSINSIKYALFNGFDTVEIDVIANEDETWVLHHDKDTGRSTGTIDNKKRTIYKTKDKDLNKIAHRDMETGKLTNIRIPTAREAFNLFNYTANNNQYLNIEIKDTWFEHKLAKLEYLAFKTIKSGNYYFSSSEFNNLKKLRKINPDVRLNYILPPAFESLRIEKNKIKKGVENDSIYKREQRKRGYDDSYKNEQRAKQKYEKRMRVKKLPYFDEKIGDNYSFSVDIRKYVNWSQKKINDYKNHGAILSTYSINGQEYHEKMLKSLPKSKLPDSVIIDNTVYGFCTIWGLPKKQKFKSNDDIANGIYNLPLDVDLERIKELPLYEKSGLYPAIGGILSPYKKVKQNKVKRMEVGKKQEEEHFELELGDSINIDLRKNQN